MKAILTVRRHQMEWISYLNLGMISLGNPFSDSISGSSHHKLRAIEAKVGGAW